MSEWRQIELPSGQRVEVPSDMPQDQVRSHLMKKFPGEFDAADTPPKDEGLRAVGNTARILGTDAAQGVAGAADTAFQLGTPMGLMDSGRGIANWILRETGLRPDAGRRPGEERTRLPSEWADKIGLPVDSKAEAKRIGAEMTPLRKIAGAVVRTGTGAMAMAPSMWRQGLVAALGAGAGQAIGGDTGELIGAIGSPLVGNAITGATRRAAIGGPTTRASMRSAIDDAEKVGLTVPSAGQAAIDSRVSPSWVENMMAKVPGNLGPVQRKSAEELGTAGSVLESLAGRAYRPMHESAAGEVIKRGLDQGKTKALDKVDVLATRVASQASGLPTPLTSYEAALTAATTKNPSTIALVPDAIPTGIKNYAQSFKNWQAANPGGSVPFSVSEEIRQSIGAAIKKAGPNALTPDGADVGTLKRLYGAVLDDQRAALIASGRNDLVKTFDAKRRLYSSLMGTPKRAGAFQMLEPLAGAKTGEDVVQMLRGWATKNPTELKAAISFLPRNERGIVASQIISKLGRGGPNGELSFAKFKTDWNELGKIGGTQDTVRRALFDNTMGAGYRADLERVFRYADRATRGSKVLFNPPQSGDVVVAAGSITGLGGAVLGGNPVTIGAAVGSLLVANVGLRALLNPYWVKALARSPNHAGRLVSRLGAISAEESDPAIREQMRDFIDALGVTTRRSK